MVLGARARLVSVAALSARDADAWRELSRSAAEPNPFFEPEFVIPAAPRLHEARGVSLIVIEDEAGWAACLPATIGRSRFGIRAARGLRTSYSFLGTPLVRAGEPATRVLDLLPAARETTGKRTFLLERYQSDGAIGRALVGATKTGEVVEAVGVTAERALLCRRPDGEYFGWMSKRHAHDLRRLRRRLAEVVADEIEVLDLSGDPDAAAIFLALEASGWKGREGTAMASDPAAADFFTELCRNFGSQRRLEILALRAGEDIIAMLCNLRSGVGSFSFKIAHDEAYSKFSPGTQLEVANAGFFHESGSEWMDSCAEPDNAKMNRIWPDRRELRSSVLVPGDLGGRLAKTGYGIGAQIWRRVRRR